MKKVLMVLAGALSGGVLLTLTSFVPFQFKDAMELANKGAAIDRTAIVVFCMLIFLGGVMYVAGHIFNAFNQKVSKYFEVWFQ